MGNEWINIWLAEQQSDETKGFIDDELEGTCRRLSSKVRHFQTTQPDD